MKYGAMRISFIQCRRVILVVVTQRSLPSNITQSRGFRDFTQFRYFGRVSRSVLTNVYLVLISQVQVRSSIVGSSASAVDVQWTEKNGMRNSKGYVCILFS